jgi:hypothetical protein
MKKILSVRVVCLFIALMMLSGARAFAAVMGSPYEVLRDSVLDALTFRNVTMEGTFRVELNGEIIEHQRIHSIVGDYSYLEWRFDELGNTTSFSFGNEYFNLNPRYLFLDTNDLEWHMAVLNRNLSRYWTTGSDLQIFTQEDINSPEMRFSLLVLDALIGDLRKNISMSSSGGVRTIRCSLTENQIPELVRAGIDMLLLEHNDRFVLTRWTSSFDGNYFIEERTFSNGDMIEIITLRTPARRLTPDEEQMWDDGTLWDEILRTNHYGASFVRDEDIPLINTGYTEFFSESSIPATREHFVRLNNNPFDFPLRDLTINHVRGEASVDLNGSLLDININAGITITNIFGDIDRIDMTYTGQFTDRGTSIPVSPIPNIEQILTFENMYARFGYSPFEVYFTLNSDGTINMDGLFTHSHFIESVVTVEDVYEIDVEVVFEEDVGE